MDDGVCEISLRRVHHTPGFGKVFKYKTIILLFSDACGSDTKFEFTKHKFDKSEYVQSVQMMHLKSHNNKQKRCIMRK